jgi:hypothetical protein
LWIFFEKKAFNRRAFWIPLILLSILPGVRSSSIGTDTENYVYKYIVKYDPNYYEFNENVEIGYQLLDRFILQFADNYFWLLFLTAFFIVFSYLRLIKKYSTNYVFSVTLFVTLGLYIFLFNGLRQALAMAIMTYSVKYLIEKKLIAYFLICLVASMFHMSALIMLPIYFIINFRLNTFYKITLLALIVSIFSFDVVQYVAQNNQRYETYADGGEIRGLYTMLFYLFIAAFIFLAKIKYKISDELFVKFSDLYFSGVVILIAVSLLGANPSGPQRIIAFFAWPLLILLPIVFHRINNKLVSFVFLSFCILYYYLSLLNFGDLFPYELNPFFILF